MDVSGTSFRDDYQVNPPHSQLHIVHIIQQGVQRIHTYK
jgi:hypothetical protein